MVSLALVAGLLAAGAPAASARSGTDTGGVGASYFPLPSGGIPTPDLGPQPAGATTATLAADGRSAIPPLGTPATVARAIRSANRITSKPYRYGGGHARFADSAYDCSGAVSFALHGAGLVAGPLDSRDLMGWGVAGPGSWITVYASPRHAFVVIAGLRFDTSGQGERGPRWRPAPRTIAGFSARHFPGL